jgi:hypothetical protein
MCRHWLSSSYTIVVSWLGQTILIYLCARRKSEAAIPHQSSILYRTLPITYS